MKDAIDFTKAVRQTLPELDKEELKELVEDLLGIIQENARVMTESERILLNSKIDKEKS